MSNNLPENDGELIEDVYENQDSNDQFDISAIGEAYANQKTYPSINPYTGQPDLSGITPVNDNTVANQNAVIDTADRTPQQYVVDTSQNAGTPGNPIVNPTIVEEAPLPRTRIVTYTSYYDMEITDYSPAVLASLQAQGYKAIAVYDDGTEAEVSWSEVRDLNPIAEYILTDIEEMTLANNQHFWTRTENPDGAGSGAFVTDDEQDAFLRSAQNNFANQGNASETVEQTETFTSDGLTTQYDLYYEAASTNYSVKVNGYNVNSGITKNTTNFVFDDAPDIDATVSVTYETQAKPWNNLLLNSYGLGLRQGLTNLATFTKSAVTFFDGDGNQNSNINAFFGRDGSRIGKETESHIELDYHSLQLIDFEGNRYLHVSDLRDHDGKGPLFTEKAVLDNNADATWVTYKTSYGFYVENGVPLVESVTVNGSVLQSSQYQVVYPTSTTFPDTVKILRSAIADLGLNADSAVVLLHIDVLVTFYTAGSLLKAFTFGNRVAGNFIGAYSVAFGKDVTASGQYSHAEGKGSVASGTHSHAEGSGTTASRFNSHAEGERSEASGDTSHAEGAQSKASGDISHAEGVICEASGYGSHAECYLTTASGDYSHAEGSRTTASNFGAHAEGSGTIASGQYSHAEGGSCEASGHGSHAEGSGTIASGKYSHASGISTKATADGQFVIGKYNAEDANAVFIIGNGTSTDVNKRSNIFDVGPNKVTANTVIYANGGISWKAGTNISCPATANNQEWSIDLPSGGTYTGAYFHVWSGKNSKSILQCFNDDNSVAIPNGPLTCGNRITASNGDTWTNGFVVRDTRMPLAHSFSTRTDSSGFFISPDLTANNFIGRMMVREHTDNGRGLLLETSRTVSGSRKYNSILIGLDSSGNPYYSLSDPAKFRSAISAQAAGSYLSTSGGTLSGDLISTNSFVTKNLNYDTTAASNSSNMWGGIVGGYDKSNRWAWYMQPCLRTDGSLLLRTSVRIYNGGNKDNSIDLIVARNGTCTYGVSNAANFRSAIGAAASSDRRLKTNLTPLGEEAVEFINSLTAYQYDIGEDMWRRHEVGVIAQDVSAADPWHTKMAFQTEEGLDGLDDWEKMKDDSPTWKLDYVRLIPPLITTVQSQAKRIERLEKIIAQLAN